MITLTGSAASPTTVNLSLAGIDSAAAGIEVQYASRPDFQFCLAPRYTTPVAATLAVAQLNQAASYYFRVREYYNTGAPAAWSNAYGVTTPLGTARALTAPALSVAPALIVPPSQVLAWTAPTPLDGYPARALGRDNPSAVFASAMPNGFASFEMQTAGDPVDTFALLDTNIPEAATIVVRGGPSLDSVRGGGVYATAAAAFRASPNMPGRPAYHGLLRLPAPQSYPFWRVDVTGALPGGVMVATYAVAGLARVAYNLSAGASEQVTDMGSLTRDRTGLPDRATGIIARSASFDISMMTDEQFEKAFGGLARTIGFTQPTLIVPNSKSGPLLHDRILYGTLRGLSTVKPYSRRINLSVECDSLI